MTPQYSPEQLEQAYKKTYNDYGKRKNVTGIDIGYRYVNGRRTDEFAVRVHVEKKIGLENLRPEEVFPERIEGVPLDVIEGVYSPHQGIHDRLTRQRNIQPGLSVGHPRVSAGTWGAVVYDNRTGRPCILSNWHVLVGDETAVPGDPILQPGMFDGGQFPEDRIGQLARSILDRRGDAAIALLDTPPGRSLNPAQYGTGVVISSARMAKLGEILEKSGRTTGVTRARVDGFGSYRISYSVGEREIEGFKLVSVIDGNPNNEEISSGGDSGAVWYDPATGEGVGLHFAGETEPEPTLENAIACHLPNVLSALEVSLTASRGVTTGPATSCTDGFTLSPPTRDDNDFGNGYGGNVIPSGSEGFYGYSPSSVESWPIESSWRIEEAIATSLQQVIDRNLSIPFNDIATSPLAKSPQLCREIQQILRENNLYHFNIDGIFGKITRESLRDFKEQHNLGGGDAIGATTARVLLNSVQGNGRENHDFSSAQGTQRAIIRECRRQGLTLNSQIAYVLATVEHETANTYKPVKEAFFLGRRADAFRRTLSYFPYFGRGYVQLTHRTNYQKYSRILNVDLVNNPDRALEPGIALFILVHGTRTGFFTGKPLGRYVNASQTDFINARRVINGLDKANQIANLARNWQSRIGSVQSVASESLFNSRPFLDETVPLSEEQRMLFEEVMGV